jgi:Tetracyclin repressor-like, C-terminal domain
VLQYAEEMGSSVGRALMRDVLAETDSDVAAARCCAYTTHHLQTLNSRAVARGEAGFPVDEAIDILIAPICYRILFANGDTSPDYVSGLLARFARLNDPISSNSSLATRSEQSNAIKPGARGRRRAIAGA